MAAAPVKLAEVVRPANVLKSAPSSYEDREQPFRLFGSSQMPTSTSPNAA